VVEPEYKLIKQTEKNHVTYKQRNKNAPTEISKKVKLLWRNWKRKKPQKTNNSITKTTGQQGPYA